MQTWQELTIDNIGNYVKRLVHAHWVPNVVINYLDHPGKYYLYILINHEALVNENSIHY